MAALRTISMNGKGKEFIHLVSIDQNILVFADAKGNLMVGDCDFSYTLNRK